MEFDVIVIGAGAAGMMCAATAGGRGRRVLLIEHASIVGEKIRISGGGRCNFTNLYCPLGLGDKMMQRLVTGAGMQRDRKSVV